MDEVAGYAVHPYSRLGSTTCLSIRISIWILFFHFICQFLLANSNIGANSAMALILLYIRTLHPRTWSLLESSVTVQSLLLLTKMDNSHNSNNPQDTCLVMFRHFMAHHKAYLLPLDLRKNVFCATFQDNVWIQYLIVNFMTNLNALLRCNIIYGDGNIIMEKNMAYISQTMLIFQPSISFGLKTLLL